MAGSEVEKVVSFESLEDERLDKLVARKLEEEPWGVTRSKCKQLIERGRIEVDGQLAMKAGTPVKAGSVITCHLDTLHEAREIKPYSHPLEILHEDEELLVINKPAGLVVHPGAGTGHETLVNALVDYFGGSFAGKFTSDARPGIVHRLDKDTTGALLIAKNDRALAALSEQFKERTASRRYYALVLSTPRKLRGVDKEDSGVIDAPLDRHPAKRTLMAVVEDGRRAVTHWRVLERMNYGSLVEAKLETGRTHQVRVHFNHIGSPVIGDRAYGDFSPLPHALFRLQEEFGRQALHAHFISFVHPTTGEKIQIEVPMPSEMERLVDEFRKV